MSDQLLDTLAMRAGAGDRAAFERLLEKTGPELRRVATRVCRTHADADDAVQSTLLILTSRTSLLRGVSRFTAWVFTVVRNQCLQLARLAWREHATDDALDERLEAKLASLDDVVLARSLVQVIEALPEPLREVFVLRELDGLSGPETAKALGLSLEAVKMRLHRARRRVRQALAEPPESDATSRTDSATPCRNP